MSEVSEAGKFRSANDLTDAPIRSQLLWASAFPLIIFGLLNILVTFYIIDRYSFDFARQMISLQTNNAVLRISDQLAGDSLPDKEILLNTIDGLNLTDSFQLLLWDKQSLQSFQNIGTLQEIVGLEQINRIVKDTIKADQQIQSNQENDALVVSTADIPNTHYRVILIEPWKELAAHEGNYQILLGVVLFLGIGFSLMTLSMAVSRIIQPIQLMAKQATAAIPGSTFRPLPEAGAKEIRKLISAFNKMVIRLAKQQAALRQYAQKAMLNQEEEKLNLSHELHDGILQNLVALRQRVELCQNELNNDPSQAHRRLDEIQGLMEDAIEDVRAMSIALRPPVLDDFGLVTAIDGLCKNMNHLDPLLKCDFNVTGQTRRLAADIELAVFRVVQEALANIRKHVPQARVVSVELDFGPSTVTAKVTNDGGGFAQPDIQKHVRSGHLGIAGMQERARLFGGKFELNSTQDQNTQLVFQLPIA